MTAPQIEEAVRGRIQRGQHLCGFPHGGQGILDLLRQAVQGGERFMAGLGVKQPLTLSVIERDERHDDHLAAHGLGGCHADFRSGLRIDHRIGLTRDGRSHDVAQRDGDTALFLGEPERRKRIRRFPGLADHKDHVVRLKDNVAVPELGRDFRDDRHTRPVLKQVLPPHARMVRGPAGNDPQTRGDGKTVELRQHDHTLLFVHTPGKAIRDNLGLFKDFLEHEVLEPAFPCGLHVPLDGLHFLPDGLERLERQHLPRGVRDADDFAVLQKNDVTRIGQERRDIRSNEMLAHAHAEDQGSGHARGKDGPRLIGADHRHGIRAVGLTQSPGKGFKQRGVVLAAFRDEMGQDFRIGFGFEDIALGEQGFLQLLKVFDDAVVDDGEFVVAADMRMGIAFGGHAMRGPARMPDAVHGDSVGIVGELFFQSRQFALSLDDLELPPLNKTDSSGIVPAVFKAPQAFDDDRNSRTMSGITNNSAHAVLLLPFTGMPSGLHAPPRAVVSFYSLFSGRVPV